jgi:hypothetical protein
VGGQKKESVMDAARVIVIAAALAIGQGIPMVQASPLGTDFTYQGQLKQAGAPASGNYDFVFRLYDAAQGGSQIGSDFVVDDWPVSEGLFTVPLDFGAGAFTAEARWLEVAVRPGAETGPHTVLSPRQALTAAPVALYALGGPGSGGYWAMSGDHIYNNNAGYVGVGTANPSSTLHVRDIGSGNPSPAARIGLQWFQPTSLNDWFSIEVGGLGLGTGSSPRLVREAGTALYFQTETQMNSTTRTTQMTLDPDGRLGLGTASPLSLLEAISTTGVHGIRSTTSAIPLAAIRTSTTGTWPAIHAESATSASGATGIRSFLTSTSPGAGSAAIYGHVAGTTLSGYGVQGSHAGYGIGVYGVSANGTGVYGESTGGGYAGYFAGTVSVDVLEIEGADVAEKFPVSERVEPGMVVAIDPQHPGKLCLARGSYNRCVAGVVSGAGNIPTGTILGNLPGSEGAPPIALSGRVWVRCDATERPIVPGDLLTTAAQPGHAMSVTEFEKAQGAVLGKAMTGLAEGTGLVLVLVNLQ